MKKTANELDLRGVAFKFEEHINIIGSRVETLDDIATKLRHLQDDMELAVNRGSQRVSYEENHRDVRILAELMHWTMLELTKNHKDFEDLTYSVLDQVRSDK